MIHRVLVESAGSIAARPDSIPFIGRKAELKAIADFCREVWEGEELAVCWVQGEAGIGKSALIEETEKLLKGSDRIIITVRMYPHAVNSVAALTAQALNAVATAQRLLTDRTGASLPSVLASLRRLTRLRSVALIFEDLHLLDEGESVELHSLLAGLRNESLPVICVSRIADDGNYRRLLLHIRRNLEVRPLNRGEMDELANASLLHTLRVDATQLYEASRGYPLLLQGLVRELQNAGPTDPKFMEPKGNGRWLVNNRAAMSIRGLTEAFLSGLTDEEKNRTRRLAVLGEVFSPQTAALLLPDAPALIERLLAKGVIVRSTTFSLPLFGPHDAAPPYRFNHTLLFEELLRETAVDEEAIIHLVEQRSPLYSLTILQQLEKGLAGDPEPERVERLIRILIREAAEQDVRIEVNQKIASQLCDVADRLYRGGMERLTAEARKILRLEILVAKLRSLGQQIFTQGEIDALEELTQLTEAPDSERIAVFRCVCLSSRLHHTMTGTKEFAQILDEAEKLAGTFPSLPATKEFMYVVAYLAGRSGEVILVNGLQRIRKLVENIMAVADPAKDVVPLSFVGTQFLFTINITATSQSEQDEALRFSKGLHDLLIPHSNERETLIIQGIRAYIYLTAGCLTEAMEIFHRYRNALNYSRDLTLMYVRRTLLVTQSAVGIPLHSLENRFFAYLKLVRETGGITGEPSPDSLPRSVWLLAAEVLTQGYLRGETAWSEEIALRITGGDRASLPGILLMHRAVALNDREALQAHVDMPRFAPLVCEALKPGAYTDQAVAAVRAFTAYEIINVAGLLELQTVLDLARLIRAGHTGTKGADPLEEVREDLAAAIRNAVDWCIRKRMPGYALPFLRFGEFYLPSKELAQMSAKAERLIEQIPEKIGLYDLTGKEGKKDSRHILTVIGTIAASEPSSRPGNPQQRFQGARVRRIIALIAANHLLQRPLSLPEFRHIATGMDPDSEKTAAYTRTLLWRVRSVIGSDAIIADGDAPPRFNTEHVRVDLLEAAELLERCLAAVRGNRPLHARKGLAEALAIIGEGPVYPTLFDEFFEAARLDFEIRLRESVRATVGLLRREGDLEEAERLLRPALASMPGDEELMEELAEILALLGRNAESVALRQRSSRQMKAA